MATLNILELLPQADAKPVQSRNWIFVLDFSGSMGWTLRPLCEHVMTEIRKVPVGDTVTVAWFSGIGYNGFIVKGTEITGEKSYAAIEQAVRNNLYTRNTTCFSEILAELQQVVTDLTPFSDTFNLLFFTDGCPVVPDEHREVAQIEKAIKAVAPELASVLFIGYGNYYNRDLLLRMTGWGNGAFVHSRNIQSTQNQIDQFMQDGGSVSGRVEITVDADTELAFALSGTQVVTLDIADGFKVNAPAGSTVWVISRKFTNKWVDDAARYAAAAILTRAGRLGDAMNVLGELGDKHFIDLLDVAYTLDDIGKAESEITSAVTDASKRYQKGRVENYIPKADAFCLLDAVDALIEDPVAKFYPQDKQWNYKRIGPMTVKESNYPKFRPDNDGCLFNTLTWNNATLNLSVLARTNGSIILPEKGAANLRIPGVFPTFKWNNYTLVKDGAANVDILPASFSRPTYNTLRAAGMVSEDWVDANHVYAIDLTSIPVMNRAIAEGYKNGKALAETVIQSHHLKAQLKVLRWHLSKLVGEKAPEVKGYTPEQSVFLDSRGIDKNGAYNPPTETVPPTDFYMVKTFEVKVKGLSSLPKVEEVIQRQVESKKQTASGQLILGALIWYSANLPDKDLEPWHEEEIANTWRKLRTTYAEIARAKFAVLLGHSWFDDVDRSNPVITVNGYEVTFAIGEKKIEF